MAAVYGIQTLRFWLLPKGLSFSLVTPMIRQGRVPRNMTLPIGLSVPVKNFLAVFWSMITTCACRRTSSSWKPDPRAISMPRT